MTLGNICVIFSATLAIPSHMLQMMLMKFNSIFWTDYCCSKEEENSEEQTFPTEDTLKIYMQDIDSQEYVSDMPLQKMARPSLQNKNVGQSNTSIRSSRNNNHYHYNTPEHFVSLEKKLEEIDDDSFLYDEDSYYFSEGEFEVAYFASRSSANKKKSSSSSSICSSPFKHQDTNYVGITINDELPQNKEQPSQAKRSSLPEISATTANTSQPLYSPIYHSSSPHSSSFSPTKMRFNSQAVIPEEENKGWAYCSQPQYSGAFRRIKGQTDLPLSYHQRLRERKRYGPLYMLTIELKTTYQTCNHSFKYNETNNPRRVLTKPSKPTKNDGYDNEDFDYILYVNDILGGAEGHKYVILDVLGSGTFGQVVKCRNTKTEEVVAIKVVKNNQAYRNQSMMEVAILQILNQRHDVHDQHHLLRLKDTFVHKRHLCLVFELLSDNLYELIKQNHFRGLSTNLVRVFTAQILDALTVLNEARIIHCDLKPENILLKNLESPTLKVIDFGSACHEAQTTYTYIQSRFYRSPEVLLGLPYTSAIDMWSLGCIAAELFLGLPLFPGNSEYNQLSRIVEMLGTPPNYMVEVGKNSHRYFDREITPEGGKRYVLKSIEKYSAEQSKSEQPSKRYFSAKALPELINSYPITRKSQMTQSEMDKEKQSRLAFIDFLQGLLKLNPIERWSPQQAKQHPFITGQRFDYPFQPPFIPRKQQLPMPSFQSKQHTPVVYHPSNNNAPQSTFSDTYLSSTYPRLSEQPVMNHHGSKRSSYVPPLPSVLEPPHTLFNHQPQHHEISTTLSNFELANSSMSDSSNHLGLPQTNHVGAIGNGRPRANTVGTMQVPSQIQWATVDHGHGTQLYSPYYPYGQPDQTNSFTDFSGLRIEGANGDILPRWNGTNETHHHNRQTIDLERDGDWQEDIPRKTHPTHRRSNSSNIMFPTIQSSLSSSVVNASHTRSGVSSLHRLVRGNSYGKQEDLEWDGVVHHSPPSNQQRKRYDDIKNKDVNQSTGEKWNHDQSGWTMA
ncbi:hypothetical protein G6F35_003290 [Rhizopus arrhizus]|nr:hypothetical protein G6F35_003290 [Rhizopus arrhizus]